MTALPARTQKKLGLVIDLDTCVGCHACATSCKEWNTGGYSAPLTDQQPLGQVRNRATQVAERPLDSREALGHSRKHQLGGGQRPGPTRE